jgi:hypothetical protein
MWYQAVSNSNKTGVNVKFFAPLILLFSFTGVQATDLQYCTSSETVEITLNTSEAPLNQDVWKEYFPLVQVMPADLSCANQLNKIEQYAVKYCTRVGNFDSVQINDRLISSFPTTGSGGEWAGSSSGEVFGPPVAGSADSRGAHIYMSFLCIGKMVEPGVNENFTVQHTQHHQLPYPDHPDFAVADAITSQLAINRLRSKSTKACVKKGYRNVDELHSECNRSGEALRTNGFVCNGQFICN